MKKKECKIIAFANQKGGVGKTTCVVNFGVILAEKGFQVLIVDLDTQANATRYFGIANPAALPYTIGHALNEAIDNGAVTFKDAQVYSHKRTPNLYLLGANRNLHKIKTKLTHDIYSGQQALKTVLAPLKKKGFDYILIDCAPSLDIDLVNALVAADDVIIVTNAGTFAFEGAEELMTSINKIKMGLNPGLDVTGIIINSFDGRNRYSPAMEKVMRSKWGDKVFETKIPRSIKVEESQCQREPIKTYDASNPVSLAFERLVDEFLVKEAAKDNGSADREAR